MLHLPKPVSWIKSISSLKEISFVIGPYLLSTLLILFVKNFVQESKVSLSNLTWEYFVVVSKTLEKLLNKGLGKDLITSNSLL